LAVGNTGFDDVRHVEIHFRCAFSFVPTYDGLTPSWWSWRVSITSGCRGAVTVDTSVEREKFVTESLERKRTNREDVKEWIAVALKLDE
jgi:hypothetical protein